MVLVVPFFWLYSVRQSMTYCFAIIPSNLPSLSIHLFILSYHHIRYVIRDVMHDFTIHKELGQLPIRISLVQGRFAVTVANLWPSYCLINLEWQTEMILRSWNKQTCLHINTISILTWKKCKVEDKKSHSYSYILERYCVNILFGNSIRRFLCFLNQLRICMNLCAG